MKLLIVDNEVEGQQKCARRIESFNQSDVEMLDLRVKLVLGKDLLSYAEDADVIIFGSGLGEEGPVLARSVLTKMPWLHVVMYVTDDFYSGGAFRSAHAAGVRKVLPENSSPLDLLQELVAIFQEFRKSGRVREGRVVCVTHAKGGTGATSICAALAEVCSVHGRRTMLWDMDVETRDLCRALTVNGAEAQVVSSWVNGSRTISRDSLCDALVPVSQEVSVLMPPDSMAEAMDLVCHTDGMELCQKILDIGRVIHDVILIDTGGRIGPATGTLMRAADEVLVVIDDTVLGLTALDMFLSYAKALVLGSGRISFLVNGYTGSLLAVPQIETELERAHNLGARPWRLPPIPVDAKASLWPGSGRTFYSTGQKSTRLALEEVAAQLQLTYAQEGDMDMDMDQQGSWWSKLMGNKKRDGSLQDDEFDLHQLSAIENKD